MKSVRDISASLVLKEAKEYREYCESESNEAYSVANKNQEEYDKQLLAISAGLLGVLLAFIKDIVPLDHAVWKHLLYWSYGCLGLCVLAVLLSFQLSIFALRKARSHWRAEYEKRDSSSFPYRWSTLIFVVNIVNGLIFALGLALGLCFIIKNLEHSSESRITVASKTIQEGSHPKLPILPSKEERGAVLKTPIFRPNANQNQTTSKK